jgi:hypothetical protein
VIFVDDFTRFTWFFPISRKSQVISSFLHFKNTMENLLDCKIKIFRTDCGGEYSKTEFQHLCSSLGILHQYSCPRTSQQNGVVERKHRHIVDIGLTLISQASLPLTFWPYAFSTAIFLINRLPSVHHHYISPWQALFGSSLDYASFRSIGCTCYPLLRPYSSHKLLPRSTKCIFLGYPSNAKGFLCYEPLSYHFYVSRHFRFNESSFPFQSLSPSSPSVSHSSIAPWLSSFLYFNSCTFPSSSILGPVPYAPSSILGLVSSASPVSSPNISNSIPQPVPCSIPDQCATTNSHPMQIRSKSGIHKKKQVFVSTGTVPIDYLNSESTTYTIASKQSQWLDAMSSKFDALQRQKTWSLVPVDSSSHTIGCRWVFKLKRNADGFVSRYKARLVAKGNHQQSDLDFDETFSPVVKPAIVRIVLSLAAQNRWSLRQLDVSNAFLHGSLKEHVYMQQPQGFIDLAYPSHVYLLHKSIYSLRQAPCA